MLTIIIKVEGTYWSDIDGMCSFPRCSGTKFVGVFSICSVMDKQGSCKKSYVKGNYMCDKINVHD